MYDQELWLPICTVHHVYSQLLHIYVYICTHIYTYKNIYNYIDIGTDIDERPEIIDYKP